MFHAQGSPEWIEERLGHITASRFSDVLTKARSGDGMGKTAESYMIDLIGEHFTRTPASELKTYAMEWGNRWEPVAREAYREHTNFDVHQVGFVKHRSERFIGCSPDSLVGESGLIEVKCPLTAANHVRVLLGNKLPDEHIAQVQGNLWITGREWCDFVSYHDRFFPELRMVIVRVERDDQFIGRLFRAVLAFRDEMVCRMEQIIDSVKRKAA